MQDTNTTFNKSQSYSKKYQHLAKLCKENDIDIESAERKSIMEVFGNLKHFQNIYHYSA